MQEPSRRWPLVFALILIALATLTPVGGRPPAFLPRLEPADILINLCLYLPLGLALAARGGTLPRVALVALAVSSGIELLQAAVIPGRRGSMLDVVANLVGTLLGLGIYHAARRIRTTQKRPLRVGAAVVTLLPGLVWAFSGALLAPSAPAPPWWGQWAQRLPNTEPFRGRIVSVSLLGDPVPDGRIPEAAALRAAAELDKAIVLEVTLETGGRTEGPAHIASVADGAGVGLVRLYQLGDDLGLSWHSRGASLGLRTPGVTFPDVLDQAPGTRLTIHVQVVPSRASIAIRSTTGVREEGQRLSALAGWRSLIPTRGFSHDAQHVFDVVWALLLLGYLVIAIRVLLRLNY